MPLAVTPRGGAGIAPGVDLVEGEDGGVVFLWGMAAWCWSPGDGAGRRLAAVQVGLPLTSRDGIRGFSDLSGEAGGGL